MAKRKQWNPKAMVEAVKAVRKKEMGYKTAAKTFQVPRATLKDYVQSSLEPEDMINRNIGRPTVLPKVIEQMLAEYCLTIEKT
uniref:HTH psq-type domain-containing protein n=1 Tax=Rhodnius prolixus TaxID=13249 RepID=T1IB85_RHOPR